MWCIWDGTWVAASGFWGVLRCILLPTLEVQVEPFCMKKDKEMVPGHEDSTLPGVWVSVIVLQQVL